MLPLLILVPLAGLVLLNLPLGATFRKSAFGVVLGLALAQVVAVLAAPAALWSPAHWLDRFLGFNLFAPDLSRVLLLSIGIVVACTTLVGVRLVDKARWHNFANMLLLALVGMNGAVLVTDIFSLYVFIEVASVSSFVLIASRKELGALEGAFKYLILSAVATILMVGAISLLMLVSGGTSFEVVRASLSASGGNLIAKVAVTAFVCGLFIKGGLVPFHGWLPDAYSAAPAAVSVLLAGVATKVCGIYALVRLTLDVFVPSGALGDLLMLVGTVSLVVGALAALRQTDFKRLLSYSSISQVGYIILGLGCGVGVMSSNPTVGHLAIAGAIFHLFNHAILKSLLFVNSAALEHRLGTTDMGRLAGLGSKMPVTGYTSLVGALSTAGVPPFSGFWSKLIIIVALWQADQHLYAAIAVLFSVVTLAYFLLMQRKIFFGKTAEEYNWVQEAPLHLVVPELALAGLTLGLGVGLPLMLNTFMLPVKSLF